MLGFQLFRVVRYSLNSSLITKSLFGTFSKNNICNTIQIKRALLNPEIPAICISRNYAKSKDKKKEKGKGAKVKVQINESLLVEQINVDSLKKQLQRALDQLKEEFIKNLSLRSSIGSFESIPVEFEGKKHTLQELAQIVRKNPKTLVVNMGVFPQAIPDVLKAIQKSGMNLNPQQDGTTLFIPIPKVTTEHREALAKNAKTLFTKCKDTVREAQTKTIKTLKRKEKVSEDTLRNCELQIIAIADSYITEGEKILESKQNELLGKD